MRLCLFLLSTKPVLTWSHVKDSVGPPQPLEDAHAASEGPTLGERTREFPGIIRSIGLISAPRPPGPTENAVWPHRGA